MINDELPNVLKSLVAQTVRGMNPSDFVLGEVISETPLVIRVGENELDEDFLILSDNVRDFEVDIEVNHITENGQAAEDTQSMPAMTTVIKGGRRSLSITD